VLVNNAGVRLEEPVLSRSVLTVADSVLEDTFAVNLFAVVRLTRALLPLLEKSEAGRIVNVSSILGSLTLHLPIATPPPAVIIATNTSQCAFTTSSIRRRR
jgi:NAD(P)-dependent dehydrogenase (short-subunit alcohol dehydrogenase family)